MSPTPQVLIMGHSFVHRFHRSLAKGSERRVRLDLNLSSLAYINYYGVGGRTVDKLSKYDLSVVGRLKPEIVILELGSNDLSPGEARPERVGSEIESLVQLLHAQYGVKFIVVCQTINNRALCPRSTPSYNDLVALLNRYLSVVLETLPFATFWCHKGLRKPNVPILCKDGIHLNHKGQYALYRSYRGAILCALRSISRSLSPKADQLLPPPAYLRSRLLLLCFGLSKCRDTFVTSVSTFCGIIACS